MLAVFLLDNFDPQLRFISQFMQNAEFFSFLDNALKIFCFCFAFFLDWVCIAIFTILPKVLCVSVCVCVCFFCCYCCCCCCCFYLFLACSMASFGPLSRRQSQYPDVNHYIWYLWPEGHREPRNEFESKIPAWHLVGFEPGTFRFWI